MAARRPGMLPPSRFWPSLVPSPRLPAVPVEMGPSGGPGGKQWVAQQGRGRRRKTFLGRRSAWKEGVGRCPNLGMAVPGACLPFPSSSGVALNPPSRCWACQGPTPPHTLALLMTGPKGWAAFLPSAEGFLLPGQASRPVGPERGPAHQTPEPHLGTTTEMPALGLSGALALFRREPWRSPEPHQVPSARRLCFFPARRSHWRGTEKLL